MTAGRAPSSGELPLTRPAEAPEDAIVRVFRVAPEQAGMRLDVFLASQLRSTSRTRARLIVENSAFSPDGRRLRASERLRAEERVVLWRPPLDEDDTDEPLDTLYEDEHLLVIDKPPLVTVHPTARYHRSTVLERLKAARPGAFLSLIHRIDRETSGLLLLAKTPDADRAFKRLLEERTVAVAGRDAQPFHMEKVYLAVTWGVPPAGLIELPLEPEADNPLRVKMRVAPEGGLSARTRVTLRDTRSGYALVACELETGRQHQIRVHLAALGCPVVGDKLYGPDERMLARAADGELTSEDRARLELPRHALHAHRYALPHALTGVRLELESPLPPDLAAFWASRAR
ncbi:MAG: RluA family pseudouridine synthase [Polyangiaceae bacterium]|nr:RluA family pseudouridine synthase [Polyangiaceae bacterium]